MKLLDISKSGNIALMVQEAYDNRDVWMGDYYREWLTNIAYFAGDQNLYFNTIRNCLEKPHLPSHRVRLVVNLVMPMMQSKLAKMLKTDPTWDVRPATADDEDITISNLSKQLLEYLWEAKGLDQVYQSAVTWTILTGNGFIKTAWDPRSGQKHEFQWEDLMPLYPEGTDPKIIKGKRREVIREFRKYTGQKQKKLVPDYYYEGDITFKVCSPFSITPDPRATSLKECQWAIETSIKPVEQVRMMFPNEDIKADVLDPKLGIHYQRRLQSPNYGTITSADQNVVQVHSVYYRPTPEAPKGKYSIVVNNREMFSIDNPFHDYIPLVHFQDVSVPGRFFATSAMKQLRPIQAIYNRKRSRIEENANLISNPKVMIPKEAGIPESSFTGKPGEKIVYSVRGGQAAAPGYLQPPELPRYHSEAITMDLRDMEDLSGQHEASQGQAPGEVRSGRGIVALQERDEDRLLPTLIQHEGALGQIGKQALVIMSERVEEPRLIRMVGKNQDVLVRTFKGSDLIGNAQIQGADYFDVRVSVSSGLPMSRSGQMHMIDSLLDRGLLDPANPDDKQLVFRILNLGTTKPLFEADQVDQAKAGQENRDMMQGISTPVQVYGDNHGQHIDAHTAFIRTNSFRQLQMTNPEIAQLFYDHISQHRLAATMLQMSPQIDQMIVMQQLQMQGVIPNELGYAGPVGSIPGSGGRGPQSMGGLPGNDPAAASPAQTRGNPNQSALDSRQDAANRPA
jgi:hypothetical protein